MVDNPPRSSEASLTLASPAQGGQALALLPARQASTLTLSPAAKALPRFVQEPQRPKAPPKNAKINEKARVMSGLMMGIGVTGGVASLGGLAYLRFLQWQFLPKQQALTNLQRHPSFFFNANGQLSRQGEKFLQSSGNAALLRDLKDSAHPRSQASKLYQRAARQQQDVEQNRRLARGFTVGAAVLLALSWTLRDHVKVTREFGLLEAGAKDPRISQKIKTMQQARQSALVTGILTAVGLVKTGQAGLAWATAKGRAEGLKAAEKGLGKIMARAEQSLGPLESLPLEEVERFLENSGYGLPPLVLDPLLETYDEAKQSGQSFNKLLSDKAQAARQAVKGRQLPLVVWGSVTGAALVATVIALGVENTAKRKARHLQDQKAGRRPRLNLRKRPSKQSPLAKWRLVPEANFLKQYWGLGISGSF